MRRALLLLAACGVLAMPAPSRAQTLQANNITLFTPTPGGYGFFTREYAQIGEHLEPYVGLWLNYARAPLVRYVNGAFAGEVVAHQLQIDLVGSISLFKIVEVGAAVPFVPFQSGDGLPSTVSSAARAVAKGAFGDVRLHVKAPFLRTKHADLAGALAVSFPTGAETAFTGEQTVTGTPRLISTFHFVNDRLVFGFDAGVLLRGPATLGNINFTHALAFGANLSYAILAERLFAGLEIYGNAGVRFKTIEETPIDSLLGVKYRLGAFMISLGGGTGITTGYGTPRFRVLAGLAFFPQKSTKIDAEPEPEPEPAPLPPPPKVKAGPKVEITREKIAISDRVYFEFDSDRINPVSYPLLDKVAAVIVSNPRLRRIRVEGHTDHVGSDEYNIDLSTRRARSVMHYLIGKGIDADRLAYKGFGFRKPKTSNASARGRAINRRVEFIIELQEIDPNVIVPVQPTFEEDSDVQDPPPGSAPVSRP